MIVRYKDKVVGKIVGNKYITERNTSKHFFIKGAGYPISSDVLSMLIRRRVDIIRIVEHGIKTRTFETMIDNYLSAPIFFEKGQEQQRCYPIAKMSEVKE